MSSYAVALCKRRCQDFAVHGEGALLRQEHVNPNDCAGPAAGPSAGSFQAFHLCGSQLCT
jgi:hypothetical protein